MRRLDQQPKHRVKFWLEQDGCPVTDTTAAIAARKRAKLLGKDQGRGDEHTVSGILSGCLFTSVQEICDNKGHKPAGKQVSKSSKAADDPLWIFQPDAPTTIQGSSHLIALTNKRYKILQSTDHTKQPAGSSVQQQQQGATLGSSWAKLQEQLQDAGTAAVAEIRSFGDLVGRRVSVWWPDDKQYYHGLITDYYCHSSSNNSSSALHSRRSSPDPAEAAAANQANPKGPGRHSKLARAAAAGQGKDTVPAKKHQARPGRPPKGARSVDYAPTAAAAAVSDGTIQKRGPGRPPKKLNAAAGSLAAGGSGGVKVKKRGSGRPPKNPAALLGAAASGSGITGSGGGGSVEKRGPGRPPKPAAAAKAAAAAPAAAADTGSGSKKRGRPPKPRGEVVWGKHRIEYDDGEVELLDLSHETWHLTDDDMAAIKTHAKQQKQQASSSSSRKDVPLPAVGDDLITFAVDRPAAVGPLMAAQPSSTAAAAAANRCARGSRITKRKDTASESAPSSDPSSSEGDSSSAESDSDESSSEDDSSAFEPDRDESSDADSDAADAEDSQGGDQREKLLKRKREAVADPAGSGGKRSKAAATAAAVTAAAAAGSGGTPAESSEHVAAPAADTAAAVAAEEHQDSKAAAATGTAAVGDTISTAKALSLAPTPATSGTAQPATAAAARTAAAASSKPQQSAFLGVLSAGFRKFMVGGGSKVPAVAANNASRASLQAATAAAAAAAVSRAVAARAGSASVTAVKPTGRATSISPQPGTKAADTTTAATGPAGPAAAAARDDIAVAGMKAVSPIVRDVPAAAAAAAAASEVRTKTPSHSPPPHPAPATLAAADKVSVSCTVSSPPPAGAAAAGLSTAVSMDPPTSAAAAAGAAAVKHNSSSTGKIPVGSPAGNSDAARNSVAAVTDTNDAAAAAADLAAAAPEAEIAQPDHQASKCLSAAAAVTNAVVMDCWQHVPVLKAAAETGARTPGAASTAEVADDDGGAGRVWRGAGDFDGDAAAAVAAAAADVAAITPARKLLDELTARLGQMDAAAAAAGSSSSSSSKAPMQMQMLVARDNMQFSLLTEQLTAGNRGQISSAAAAAEHGSDAAAVTNSSCLAVLLVKLPAGFDRCSVAVQSSSSGLEVCYKAAERSTSEAAGLAAGAAVQDRNVNNMTVKDFTQVVHLPSDLAWIKGSTPSSAYGPGDGTSNELAALEEVAAPVTTEVVALLQYSSTWGKLMVLGKCCRI